jgi:hypothetical protein
MLTPQEVMRVLQKKNQMLTQKNDDYINLADNRAEAERDYKVAYATHMLKLKTEGNAVTMIRDLCAGNKGVADLKFQYEVSLAIEKACLESMKDIREAIGSARSILTWQRTELESR